MKKLVLFVCMMSLVFMVQNSEALNLIQNGDFETGVLTAPWYVVDRAGSSGSFYVGTPGSPTPFSGRVTQSNPAGGGNWYAVI